MRRHARIDGTSKKGVFLGVVTIAAILSAAIVVFPEKSSNMVFPTKPMPPALIP